LLELEILYDCRLEAHPEQGGDVDPRLGTFELLYMPATPVAVVIDESIELARAYAGDEPAQFVNGVLGHVARERA